MYEVKLKLTIDGKESNATLSLTDGNIKKIVSSVNRADEASRTYSRNLISGLQDARNSIQGIRESYNILRGIFGGTVGAYKVQEQSEVSLQQALKSTGQYTKENYEELKQYASALQQATTFGDELTLGVMAQLTVMGLSKNQIKQATLQSQNLAAVMKVDLNTAARAMADLFNGNIGMIGRYVKGLDEAVVKSGDLDAIMEMLNSKIGGQAEAMAKTTTGALEQFNNTLGDSQEKVGEVVATGILPFVRHLNELITSVNNASPALTGTIGTLGVMTTAMIVLKTTGILPLIFNHNVLIGSLSAARINMIAGQRAGLVYAGGMRAAATATKGFFASLGPIGWAILGLTALAEIINLIADSTEDYQEKQEKLNTELGSMKLNDLRDELSQVKEYQKELDDIVSKRKQDVEYIERNGNSIEQLRRFQNTYNLAVQNANNLREYSVTLVEKLKEKEDQIRQSVEQQVEALKKRIEVEIQKTDKDKQLVKLRQTYDQEKSLLDEALALKLLSEEEYQNKLTDLTTIYNAKRAEAIKNASSGLLSGIDKQITELNNKKILAGNLDELIELEKQITKLKKEKSTIEGLLEYQAKGSIGIDIAIDEDLNDIELPDLKLSDKETTRDLKSQADIRNNQFEEEYRLLDLWKKRELELYADDAEAKTLIDKIYSKEREKISEAETEFKVGKVKETLSVMGSMLNESTTVAKGMAVAMAMINTYEGAAAAIAPPPVGAGPILGPLLMAGIIAKGLAQVSEIASQDVPQYTAYEHGGALVGEKGVEIIAPARDFASGMVDLILAVENALGSRGVSTQFYSDNLLLKAVQKTNDLLTEYLGRPALAVLDDRKSKELIKKGISSLSRGMS